jgi:hypothetical protein
MAEEKAPNILFLHPADILLYFDPSSSKPVDSGVNQVVRNCSR